MAVFKYPGFSQSANPMPLSASGCRRRAAQHWSEADSPGAFPCGARVSGVLWCGGGRKHALLEGVTWYRHYHVARKNACSARRRSWVVVLESTPRRSRGCDILRPVLALVPGPSMLDPSSRDAPVYVAHHARIPAHLSIFCCLAPRRLSRCASGSQRGWCPCCPPYPWPYCDISQI